MSLNSSQSFAPSSSKVLTLSLRALVSLIFSRSFSSSSSIASTLVLHFPCFTISAAISALVLSIALFRLSIVCPEVRTSWSYRLFRIEHFSISAVSSSFTFRSSEVRSLSRANDEHWSSSSASTLVLHFSCLTISAAISALVFSIALFRLSIVGPEVRTSWS